MSSKNVKIKREATHKGNRIIQYHTGTIALEIDDRSQSPVLPHLRDIAAVLKVEIRNRNDNPKNTRLLGDHIIKRLLNLDSKKQK